MKSMFSIESRLIGWVIVALIFLVSFIAIMRGVIEKYF